MIKRFPHIMNYQLPGTPGGWDDENGIPIPGTPGESISIQCRAEENVRENYTITGDDGNRIDYKFVVYFDKSDPLVEVGQEVEVFKESHVLAKEVVKRFHPGQLHNRVWI